MIIRVNFSQFKIAWSLLYLQLLNRKKLIGSLVVVGTPVNLMSSNLIVFKLKLQPLSLATRKNLSPRCLLQSLINLIRLSLKLQPLCLVTRNNLSPKCLLKSPINLIRLSLKLQPLSLATRKNLSPR